MLPLGPGATVNVMSRARCETTTDCTNDVRASMAVPQPRTAKQASRSPHRRIVRVVECGAAFPPERRAGPARLRNTTAMADAFQLLCAIVGGSAAGCGGLVAAQAQK